MYTQMSQADFDTQYATWLAEYRAGQYDAGIFWRKVFELECKTGRRSYCK